MKRWLKWGAAVLALTLLGALVGRAIVVRKSEQAQLAAKLPANPPVDLAPADLIVVQPTELVRTLEISGGLKAVESAVVKARVPAEVVSVAVREGDRVVAGQLLGRLDATEFEWRLRQAEQQAASAKAQLDIAERALANNKALVDQGFISKNALDTSAMNAAGAQASMQAAQAAVELARKALRDTEIRSPLTGTVSQRFVQPGERAALDARLLEIVDLSRIEVEAAISPDDVGLVRVGSEARLQVDGIAQPVPARVVRINPSTQAGTRAVMIYLALAERPASGYRASDAAGSGTALQPGLRQGLFARGAVELQRRQALAVPVSTVRVDQARPYMLVVVGGRIAQRVVTLGERGVARFDGPPEPAVEITAGLAPGDMVVRGSVGSLREGSSVRTAEVAAPTAAPSASSAR